MQQIGKKELKAINEKLKRFDIEISKKENVSKDDNFIFVNNEIKFFEYHDLVLPSLKTIYSNSKIENSMKKVTIDMGAVKFAIKGADLMKPGIPKFDDGIVKGEPVLVVDESHGKAICVGISEFSDEDYKSKDTGKAIINIHYVGDTIWHNKQKP